jgi:hypothetical protein
MKINPTLNPEIFDIFINYAGYYCAYFETNESPSRIKECAIEFSKLSGGHVRTKALVVYYEFVKKLEKNPFGRNEYVSINRNIF